jgi:hypothetical protein
MITIKSINDMRSRVSHKEEIREAEIDPNLSCFCYMLSAENTFDSDWARECRGIVFNTSSGQVVGRPLHKFFNVGEREDTRSERIDWSKVIRVMDKRDGCCDENTILNTADGQMTIKEICDSQYSGLVLGWNHVMNETQWTPILGHQIQDNNSDWYEIEMENGTKIKLTGNHMVWCTNRSKYIRVDQLTLDDEFQALC